MILVLALAVAALGFLGWVGGREQNRRIRDLESRLDVAEADLRNLKGVPPRT